VNVHRQQGLSLIELMISMMLGLMLMAGMLTLFHNALQSSRDLNAAKQLEDELHGTLDLIVRDLRRTGAMGNPIRQMLGVANPFGLDSVSAYTGEAASSCLTSSYDLDGDGTLDTGSSDERFGYRLRASNVQMRVSGQACTANITPAWNAVTTLAQIQITALRFATTVSTALGITTRTVVVTMSGRLASDAAVTRTLSRTVRLRNDSYAP
jgi:prepilin peptidase dependent protein B